MKQNSYLNTVRKLAIFSLISTFSIVTAFGRVVKDVSDGGTLRQTVFPDAEWEKRTPETQGIDSVKLRKALEYMKSRCGKNGISEVMIVRNGYVIWQGDKILRKHSIASAGKTFTSTALGLLIDKRKCSLDSRAAEFIPELAENYPDVALKHFAMMTSGYDAVGLHTASTKHQHNVGKTGDWGPNPYDAGPPLFAPGEKFCYHDEAMFMFGRVLTAIAGQSLHSYLKKHIGDVIGMGDWQWRSGRLTGEINGIPVNWGCGMVVVNADQLARWGLLFLNRGNWSGKQLISKKWVDEATRNLVPRSIGLLTDRRRADGRGVYGYNWWVNGIKGDGKWKWPDAPPKTFVAIGADHNMCFVIPEWNMVIVRLGTDGSPRGRDGIWSTTLKMVGQSLQETPRTRPL